MSSHARFSTIDRVRFHTVPDQQIPAASSPAVIWIGVLPDSLIGEEAFHLANTILALLKDEGITTAVDIEFRESIYKRSGSTELYEPASDLDVTRHVIDPLTTALGLPIAAAKTPHFQGTMAFYFQDSEDLYGVTARHILFPADEDNSHYHYNPSGPRKDVLLMGTQAWDNYLTSVKSQIGNLDVTAEILKESIERLKGSAEGKEEAEADSGTAGNKPSQRVIGYIDWSPAITVGTGQHHFTQDVCVVKLDKARFLPNFKGNVIDLGTEMEAGKFVNKMYPCKEVQPGFEYPADRLLQLRQILTEDRMRHPNMRDHHGEDCLYVIKRGLTTLTTIGRATGLFSYAREYFANQTHRDSTEWAILPYDNESGAFSKGGDSGSIIASGTGEFGGLLTGGSGMTESSDINYATPMFWLWPVIKAQYFNANLYPKFN
ncbi:hypothetical protein BDR07DRAFT_1608940 [Suillus spraguei]|nr:hypothetical protein BDR07DRAFT_1608940 [Suillus spraguei]